MSSLERIARLVAVSVMVAWTAAAAVTEEKLIRDIETDADIRRWDKPKGTAEVSTESPLKGRASVKVTPGTYFALFSYSGIVGDWSGYDVLAIDFNNTTGKAIALHILVADRDWDTTGRKYWDRHNSNHVIPPGKYTFKLPITGLYRGEAGSRYNVLKYPIKPGEIIRFDLGIGSKNDGNKPVYFDNIRLISAEAPDFVKAFDFGPTEQNVAMGFTPATWDTAYDKQKGYGLNRKLWHQNRARDDTFPPGPLMRDWVEMAEDVQSWEFLVDVPNGTYHVVTMYSDPGYWGGESARHRTRKIFAEGKLVHSEDHGEKGYRWRVNHLFENVEPKPGDDFWDLYCAEIYKPIRFKANVTDGQLNIRWENDAPWSNKVNCLIVYPDSKKDEGSKFVEKVLADERAAFRVAAAMKETPSGGTIDALPDAEKRKGYVFFLTDAASDTYLTTIPRPGQIARKKAIFAAPGEYEPVTFAVRPLKDLGKAKVTVSDFRGPRGASIPSSAWQVRVVRHLSRRGFSAIGYRIIPQMLREFDSVELPKDLTREFWATVKVPADARAGTYSGSVTLTSDKGLRETVTVTLDVLPVKLDGSDYVFGFFGAPPNEKVGRMLLAHGMNSFSGGPRIGLKGFDAAKRPELDFAAADEFMERTKSAGFTQELCGYGGPGVAHVGYTKDEKFFGDWEKKTEKSYVQLLKAVFDEVRKHSRVQSWLPFTYNLGDETRNVEYAKKQVAQIRAIQQAAPWLKTTAQYSVSYRKGVDPKDYHQWLFEALKTSGLNNHDDSVMKRARGTGKQVYIYNQGQSRYSFGAYQWSEYRKGVRGRFQWAQHVQHGFQFFDLDGREPDTGVIYYGEDGPIPTLALERCREGADDFYYCQTLWNLAEKSTSPVAAEARKWLESWTTKIEINERRKPEWLSNHEIRARCAAYILRLKGDPVPEVLRRVAGM